MGPRYFGCIRMVSIKYLYFMMLLESIYLMNSSKSLVLKCTNEDSFVFYLTIGYCAIFNVFATFLFIRVIQLYRRFDEHSHYFDLTQNSTLITACNIFIGLYVVRLILLIGLTVCITLSIEPFASLSGFHDLVKTETNVGNDTNTSQDNLYLIIWLLVVPITMF